MKKNAKLLSAVFALAALPCSAAAQFGTDHVPNAQTFLRNEASGSLGFIQTGCRLKGVNADTVTRHAGRFAPQPHTALSGSLRSASMSDREPMAALDRKVFGADRRRVLTQLR